MSPTRRFPSHSHKICLHLPFFVRGRAAISPRPFSLAFVLGLLWLLGPMAAVSTAQYSLQTGSPTFTTALPVELGFLNIANGNLHLQVNFGSYPERGSRPLAAGLVYDSRIWNSSIGTWQPTNVPQGGWRFFTNVSPGSVSVFGNRQECDSRTAQYTIYSFSWTDPLGTKRAFQVSTEYDPTLCDAGNNPTDDGFAGDGSGYHMYVVNYTQVSAIYAPDGTQVYPSVKDTNGNYFSLDGNGNVIDPVGRTPVTVTSNCNGNSSQTCYNVLNSQGTRSTYTVTTTSISVSTAFGQTGVNEYSGTITVIQSVQLPDATTYQFGYDSYGELNSITLPTGGQVTYGYTNFQDTFGNKNRWVNSRTSGGGAWSYTPQVNVACPPATTLCSQQVTVAKPSGDNSLYVHMLTNGGAWLDTITYYNGSVSTANQIASVSNSWDFSQPSSGRILNTVTTLQTPGGNRMSSQTSFTYNDVFTSNAPNLFGASHKRVPHQRHAADSNGQHFRLLLSHGTTCLFYRCKWKHCLFAFLRP